jgi:hypothetical protein
MDAHMHCSLFHLVDLGASCSAALNNPSFRGKYGYSASRDLSREAIVSDNAFSSLNALEGQPLLPCADLEAAVYTLVFLASCNLPWAPGPECPVAGAQPTGGCIATVCKACDNASHLRFHQHDQHLPFVSA